jgi:thiol-disulfide isomerase/thioredoxin
MVSEIAMTNIVAEDIFEDGYMTILMFYGASCGPCKATMPNYESAAEHFTARGAKIRFYRINAWDPVEQKEYCTNTWGINGVPHFKVFFNKQEVLSKAGGGDYNTMTAFIQDGVDVIFRSHSGVV